MSASSLWVTCGIITQLRARFGAEIFWIRERGTRSIGPNFSKSTSATGEPRSALAGAPVPAGGAGGTARPDCAERTSSAVIRPLRPVPLTRS
jgi:hypothetical protein